MDLTRSVTFRGYQLNSVTEGVTGLVGCRIDSADYSEVEVRQFTEPIALADGLDVGGVWLGRRVVKLNGSIFDISRGAAFDRIAALDAIMVPTADFIASPTYFGYGTLAFYVARVTAPGYVAKSLRGLSQGLRVQWRREMFGGADSDALAIPWSVTLVCKDPAIS